jgi:hypothetical protein
MSNKNLRTMDMNGSTVNLDERLPMKLGETFGSRYSTITGKSEADILRSQINETDILNDMAHARSIAQDVRHETIDKDKEKKLHDKDADKDSLPSNLTASMKKKFRKQEENLDRILDAPDCLDEAAIALNFLTRRLLCDVFDEPLFKDLLKEKIELKLKEIAVSIEKYVSS